MGLAPGRGLPENQGRALFLQRAVDHEGDVVEAVVTARRDQAAALKLRKRVREIRRPLEIIVTDRLRLHSAAMDEIGVADRDEVGRHLSNRAENFIDHFDDSNSRCSDFDE